MALRRKLRDVAEMTGLIPTRPAETVVRVAGFPLTISTRSPLLEIFASHPDYNGALARLVAVTLRKYPDALMIDVGANVGDTVAVARSGGPIPIVCFEGDPEVFPYLERNLRQFANVAAYQVYLGERTEEIRVTVEKAGWNATLVPGTDGETIALTTLDDFLVAERLPSRPKVLKIDAEGFDARILRGAKRLLARDRPAVLFEYNRHNMAAIAEEGLPVFRGLRESGYDAAFFYDAQGRLMLVTGLEASEQVRDLHDYADGWNAAFPYFDVCVFHAEDHDMAMEFAREERAFRASRSGPEEWHRRHPAGRAKR